MTEKPLVVTYENDDSNTFSQTYFTTLISNSWMFMRVGNGEKWEGFISKIHAYREACMKVHEDQILVFSDARDVFCLRKPDAFLDAFKYFNVDIVCSAELFCEGRIDVPDDFKGTQCTSLVPYFKFHGLPLPKRKFVNTGLIAGKAKALFIMWQWILDNGFNDDQLGVGTYMNKFPELIKLDTDAILLHTSTFGVEGGIFSIHSQKHDSPTFAELFGCGAFFLHLPGRGLKGQKLLYDLVKTHLEIYKSTTITDLYGKRPPGWDDYGDLT